MFSESKNDAQKKMNGKRLAPPPKKTVDSPSESETELAKRKKPNLCSTAALAKKMTELQSASQKVSHYSTNPFHIRSMRVREIELLRELHMRAVPGLLFGRALS